MEIKETSFKGKRVRYLVDGSDQYLNICEKDLLQALGLDASSSESNDSVDLVGAMKLSNSPDYIEWLNEEFCGYINTEMVSIKDHTWD